MELLDTFLFSFFGIAIIFSQAGMTYGSYLISKYSDEPRTSQFDTWNQFYLKKQLRKLSQTLVDNKKIRKALLLFKFAEVAFMIFFIYAILRYTILSS